MGLLYLQRFYCVNNYFVSILLLKLLLSWYFKHLTIHILQQQQTKKDVYLEGFLGAVLYNFIEQLEVGLVEEFVAVDTRRLVHPQTHQLHRRLGAVRHREQHTLKHKPVYSCMS